MIGTTAALIMGGLAAGGALGGAAISSHAANKAADTQSAAAEQASHDQLEAARIQADAQLTAAREANALQEKMYQQGRADLEPWRAAGAGALGDLTAALQPGGELAKTFDLKFDGDAYKFDPSKVDVTQDPGYQFRLEEGQKALERSLAARGGSLGGAALKAAARYNQGFASNEYGNAFNRAFTTNADSYNRAKGEYDTAFNVFNSNQANRYNRLAGLAGVGQQATQQLANAGQAYAGQVGSNLTNSAANAGNIIINGQNAASNALMAGANARASGYVGGANAWGGALGNIGNTAMNLYLMSQLGKSGTPGVPGVDLATLRNLGISLP